MIIHDETDMRELGVAIGRALKGGEVLELIGDVGAGKTTFVKGLAAGLHLDEDIQSPSFTINRRYENSDGVILSHYDFYRLADAGIMNIEISESLHDPNTITVVEWANSVKNVLPDDRITVQINYLPGAGRDVSISYQKNISISRYQNSLRILLYYDYFA